MTTDNPQPEQQPTLPPTPFDDLIKDFPAEARWLIRSTWEKIPLERRRELVELLPNLPLNGQKGWRSLLDMAQTQAQMAFGGQKRVVIIGPTNVGKSTLYNQLIRAQQDAAVVSPIPGTTKVAQQADAGLFAVVDTPGLDAVGAAGRQERERALAAAHEADFLIIMFDAVQGIKRDEQTEFAALKLLEKPFVVVLNKMDLVGRRKKARERVLAQTAVNLALPASQIIPIVALGKGENIGQLLTGIVKADPSLLATLGEALPSYRRKLAWQATLRAASTAALVALTPLPILDFIPLLATQATLVLSIARVYTYKITPARAREMVGTFGMGYLGRTLFYEVSKWAGGAPGWLISTAVATATTLAIGYSAILWFERGERLTAEGSRKLVRRLSERLVAQLRERLGQRRPGKGRLRETLVQLLEESLADDSLLEEVERVEERE